MSSAATPAPSPVIGLFIQLDRAPHVTSVYRDALDLISAAEELGFASVRVAQHHFGQRYGRLPAPLLFLVAAAQRTRRIRLGTALITVPFEHPLRLAEDAAVADCLMDGRLELGLGSGFDPAEFATFGVDMATRRERTTEAITLLQRALRGEPLSDDGARLEPAAPSLAERLWLGVMTPDGARHAAQMDLGILLGRVERGSGPPTQNQAAITQAYRAALGPRAHRARIAAGRTVYPARDAASARHDLSEALGPLVTEYVAKGLAPQVDSWQERLAALHMIHGHPDDIIPVLRAEQAAIGWTELMIQVDPGDLPLAKALRALELFATDVMPHLAQ